MVARIHHFPINFLKISEQESNHFHKVHSNDLSFWSCWFLSYPHSSVQWQLRSNLWMLLKQHLQSRLFAEIFLKYYGLHFHKLNFRFIQHIMPNSEHVISIHNSYMCFRYSLNFWRNNSKIQIFNSRYFVGNKAKGKIPKLR